MASFLYFQLHRFVSVNKLKYFFAVDTAYVAKKLGLLVFPYTHQVSIPPGELASLSPLVKNLTDPQISTPSLSLCSCFPDHLCHCQNWNMQYSHDVPLPPRKDLNAPDLYIPSESLMWGWGHRGLVPGNIVRKTIQLMILELLMCDYC